MSAVARRALVLGPPLVLGLLELGRPGVMPGAAGWIESPGAWGRRAARPA